MDWIFVGFVGLLGIALAVAIGVALDRDRELEATRAALTRTSLVARPPVPGGTGTRGGAMSGALTAGTGR